MNEHKVDSLGMYLGVFGALMVLTLVTVGAAYIDFGRFSVAVALAIATVKAVLVIWFFMHVQHGDGLLKMFVLAGFLAFFLLVTITLSDYITRPSAEIDNSASWIKRQSTHFQTKPQPLGFKEHHTSSDAHH
jgi:cytochrome c oxidase subunit 4